MCGAAGADGMVRAVAVDPPVRPFCNLLRDWPGVTEVKNSQHKCVQHIHLCGHFVISRGYLTLMRLR